MTNDLQPFPAPLPLPTLTLIAQLDLRDLLDAEIEALQLMKWHQEQIERLKRERVARAPRLEAYRRKA